MSARITFVSASAGSGKTHRVTEIIDERLADGRCRPSGLVATTYTVKAAQELRSRLRQRLHQAGRDALAERLGEGLISTVHGICRGLLERFAFEAGISPQLEVLAEEEARSLLLDAVGRAVGFDILRQLQRLGDALGQRDLQTGIYWWKRQVRDVIDSSRANDLSPDSFDAMAQRSVDELLAFFSPPAGDDLDAQLADALEQSIREIRGNEDATKVTADYMTLLQDCRQVLATGRLPWSTWAKLAASRPARRSEAGARPVIDLAMRLESHPRLQADIREYTGLIFAVARQSLSIFQRSKEERGLVDFADLEMRALHLLRNNAEVAETLRGELDLLVVDEFQDTSPIQLALFNTLAACARETFWVGDVKQAIYGFRGSDPGLINEVVRQLKISGTVAEPLGVSYRSVPELVRLANAVFVPAFHRSLGMTEKEVSLAPARPAIEPAAARLEVFEVSSGRFTKNGNAPIKPKNEEYALAVADGIARIVDGRPEARLVFDRSENRVRPVRPRDIAVLCRTNDAAANLAAALSVHGMPVSLARAGLMSTPEVRQALACLRRLADARDSLATAEVMVLRGGLKPEDWLESRLDYVARQAHDADDLGGDRWGLEGSFAHPAIQALEKAREHLPVYSPSEALDAAMAAGDTFATVSAWGPDAARAAQRRANLESLRTQAVRYEEACATRHAPASIAGFLFWCDDHASAEADVRGGDDEADAIHLTTYHKAKGLEWPVVICTDLESEPRTREWDVHIAADDPEKAVTLGNPLSNRRLRFWVWPFGRQQKGTALADRVAGADVGQRARRAAGDEDLRLLYVGFTRARDLLVLAVESGQPTPWLDALEAPWLRWDRQSLGLPDGTILGCRLTSLLPNPGEPSALETACHWFPPPIPNSSRLPARILPSAQEPPADAAVGRVIDFGSRLPLTGKPEEADLGDALHAILAAHFIGSDGSTRPDDARAIVQAHGLGEALNPAEVNAMVHRFRAQIEATFQPRRCLVEVPFNTVNDQGQSVSGFIDLLLETDTGWVVIDHKSFPGERAHWPAKALSYSGQMETYRRALENLGRPVTGCWIHFAVSGAMLELLPPPIRS